MSVRRGDVVLAWYPFASGQGGKRRPCVVVQNDPDNGRLANTMAAQVTSNLARAGDPSHVVVTASSPDGQQAGLLHDSIISCNNLATIEQALIQRVIGTLTPALAGNLEAALKSDLALR